MPPGKRCVALLITKQVGDREKSAVDRGAIVVRKVDQFGFDDEAAEFDQVPRALAAIHGPLAKIMPSKFRFEPPPSGFTTAERRLLCRQQYSQFFVTEAERTPRLAYASPP